MPFKPETSRKNFIKQLTLLVAGLTIMPKSFLKASAFNEESKAFKMHKYAIIDMHCHPSMKMFLWGEKFWKWHWGVSKGENLLDMQENNRQFSFGNVRGMMAAHYLLEASSKKEWNTLKSLYPILKRIPFLDLKDKIEHEDRTNFDQVMEMINMLEGQMYKMNSKDKTINYVIARNYKEYEAALNDPNNNSIAIAHAIEGGHALGRDCPISHKRHRLKEDPNSSYKPMIIKGVTINQWDPYLENLKKFHEKGVCLMTLSHFFRNDLSYPVDGMSPDSKKVPGMAWQYTPDQDRGLTPVGTKVVEEMLRIGMIVDLTHSDPKVRSDVFEINKRITIERTQNNLLPRPIVFTHTGAQTIYDYYDQGHYPYYKYYCVSDEEIKLICDCNGVIGVIPENFWLVGADTHMRKEFRPGQFKNGIDYMIQTMKYINSKTKDRKFDNIGIGTDFDGLADNPSDLYKNKQLKDLFEAMKMDPEIGADDGIYIEKIAYLNAKRVLKDGWG
jgi:microsomal dipeptidase-like Zn-dependent dipeptidase